MARGARRLALGAALTLAAGCAREPGSGGPVPLSVTPALGTAAAAMPVEIAGRDFEAWTRADLGSSRAATLDARFGAALEPAAGGDAVALQGVTMTEQRTLRATVPAGLARGTYRLHVTDPRGRSGTLERAFRIVAPADTVAAFRVALLETPRAGIAFTVALSAVDAQGLVVDGFEGSVPLADRTGAMSPGSTGPFVAGRSQVQVVIRDLAAGDQITAGAAPGPAGTSEPFDVLAGPPSAVVFPERSVTAVAGACSPRVDLELRDALDHPAPAEAEVVAQLQSSPPGIGFFSDAACTAAATSATVPAGSRRASFYFQSRSVGTVTIRALPATLPSASQDETVSP